MLQNLANLRRIARLGLINAAQKRFSSQTGSLTEGEQKVLNELTNSRTALVLKYEEKNVYVIGDIYNCPKSLERIERIIDTLQPKVVLLEVDEAYTRSKFRSPKFRGNLLNQQYRSAFASKYPQLKHQMPSYEKEGQAEEHTHDFSVLDKVLATNQKIEQDIEQLGKIQIEEEKKPHRKGTVGGDDKDESQRNERTAILKKYGLSKWDKISEDALHLQKTQMAFGFRPLREYLVHRSKNMEELQNLVDTYSLQKASQPDIAKRNEKVPSSFMGSMEGQGEREAAIEDQIQLETLKIIENIAGLRFIIIIIIIIIIIYPYHEKLMSTSEYERSGGSLKTWPDWEKSQLDQAQMRNILMNQYFQLLVRNSKENEPWHTSLFNAMRLWYAARDRRLVRKLYRRLKGIETDINSNWAKYDAVEAEKIKSGLRKPFTELEQQQRQQAKLSQIQKVRPIIGIVDSIHLFGIKHVWDNSQFWDEELEVYNAMSEDTLFSKEEEEAFRKKLKDFGMPFVEKMPSTDKTKK
ncbi:hypothetical protein RFI_00604 [Reticulomyxa filosa]|uniref:Uncharacterized protein n=1 Tax=Reticulomyxa filosa TaxID=46433 RepID=X6PEK0_RETFI|nr:hypothetical protein RFI_00604 [Reticulomyxa filosa]|eukprot:ETO36459.1 hypothetical protein RFI_00604 [Reticulomyxa filosa]